MKKLIASGWVCAALAAVVVVAGCGIRAQAVEAAKKSACQKNLKLIGTAFMNYARVNNDVYNFDATSWKTAVAPFVTNPNVFNCPSVTSGESYSFNAALSGVKAFDVKEPLTTVLVYEGKDGKLDFRHEGVANVLFTDGHVQTVAETRAGRLIWKP